MSRVIVGVAGTILMTVGSYAIVEGANTGILFGIFGLMLLAVAILEEEL